MINKSNRFFQYTLIAAIGFAFPAGVLAQAVTAAEAQNALNLYKQQKYDAAVYSFEKIIQRQPTASYCYYAALANHADHKDLRAQQLFQYIVTNYPQTQEAAYSKQALSAMQPVQSAIASTVQSSNNSELPETIKAMLPPEMQKLLNTPAGKQAVMDAMRQHPEQFATVRKGEESGILPSNQPAAAAWAQSHASLVPANAVTSPALAIKDHPFSTEDIRRGGAAAIDQMSHPNCWFEASMAALAELPRGQSLIASMIRGHGADSYVVRFPGDGVEYNITTADLQQAGIHDSGLWASLIECAQLEKFPNNAGAEGKEGDQSRLEVGLGCITGRRAEVLNNLGTLTPQELSSFIGGAVRSGNPVVAGTLGSFGQLPVIAVTSHAYTIIGFDPANDMITIRNPWGRNQPHFSLASDPQHLEFELLNDGKFKMSVQTFQKYFYTVARSFI